nr:MAG TPA: hypothetical protein [Caudoviricetes sp.]
MLNRLLIVILKYKRHKLLDKKCGECDKPLSCDYCRTYNIQKDINNVIFDLKEWKV